MKLFRSILSAGMMTIAVFACVVYSACSKNNCGNYSCQNNGTCTNGVCVCPTGYTGQNCENTWSKNYVGTYTCTQVCSPSVSSASWTSVVSADATNGNNHIDIASFGNTHVTVVATIVDDNNNILIPQVSGSTTSISGSGVFHSNDTLKIDYSYGNASNCTMIMVKQ
jgi:hypothetical protein